MGQTVTRFPTSVALVRKYMCNPRALTISWWDYKAWEKYYMST